MGSSSILGTSSVPVLRLCLWSSLHIQLKVPRIPLFRLYLLFPASLCFYVSHQLCLRCLLFFSLVNASYLLMPPTCSCLSVPHNHCPGSCLYPLTPLPIELEQPLSTRKLGASQLPFSVLTISGTGCVPLLGEDANNCLLFPLVPQSCQNVKRKQTRNNFAGQYFLMKSS